ncbi:EF-P lysine aminoacylase EpmA [Desulfolithobacter sp.]
MNVPSGCLQQRSRLLQAVRDFFLARDYIEVDTPIRLPSLIPESQIEPVTSEGWLLQTSPELCMKRLLARGWPRIFQICHCFRGGESGRLHLPEFTMLEWYQLGWDYNDLMAECESFIRAVARACGDFPGFVRPGVLASRGCHIDLESTFDRLTVAEAFHRYGGMSAAEAVTSNRFDEILVTRVEPHLGWSRPVFLHDYPLELASLARKKPGTQVAERFELYIGGVELANGFSELVDGREQRQRFVKEIARAAAAGRHFSMPEQFLADLDSLDAAAGIALGFDRLLMVFAGADEISQVVAFSPQNM